LTYWKTEHFRRLQAAWYEQLEESGFEDAEELINGHMVLKEKSGISQICSKDRSPIKLQAREEYFRILREKIEDTKFSREMDRLILTRYAEGTKINDICEELEQQGDRRCRGTVRFTVRKYEKLWGLKNYSDKQLNKPRVLPFSPFREFWKSFGTRYKHKRRRKRKISSLPLERFFHKLKNSA